jgi:hypothetical protein
VLFRSEDYAAAVVAFLADVERSADSRKVRVAGAARAGGAS